ncbi:MAG: hypothetical protein Q8Q30_02265 [Candidatus Woesebacteria bacterium]|nr:hypothetical protein [Candidatus Woesebacteria bacterium]
MSSKLPKNLQGILWSMDINDIDPIEDKDYIIHQILAYGAWDHLVWLIKQYGKQEVKSEFVNHPSKDYSSQSFNFAQKILFNLPDSAVDKRYYVKTFPRIIK